MAKLKILVFGYIVRGPLAGMTWHYLNYILGLKKLGHDVYYFEDSGESEYCCYIPEEGTGSDPTYGLNYASTIFEKYDLKNNWAYYDKHKNQWHGKSQNEILKIISGTDILINISIANPLRSWFEKIPVKILIDTDPVFTQIRNLSDTNRNELCKEHNHFFTFGENFGNFDCMIPNDGLPWKPTRQPVYLDAWKTSFVNINNSWTTVMQWESYSERTFKENTYGMKSKSFEQIINIPTENPLEKFILATGNAPVNLLNSHGWNIVNSLDISKSIDNYQQFIGSSKGEFTVAKHGYKEASSGWFSERSACYLASGKPVITQETGFSKFIPTGDGLFSFKDAEESAHLLKEVSSDYIYHCKSAREIAEEYFSSDKILTELLNQI